MKRGCNHGFTLAEVLIAVAIVGLLAVLLAPAGSEVWEAALATRCRHNLRTVWQAQRSWQSEKQSSTLVSGDQWASALAGYVEAAAEVFTCPSAPESGGTAEWTGGYPFLGVKMFFKMYARHPNPPGYRCTVPVCDEWAMYKRLGPDCWQVNVEDMPATQRDCEDIEFIVHCEDRVPVRIDVREGASGSRVGLYYEFHVNGVRMVENWETLWNQSLELPKTMGPPSSYGLSMGTYEAYGRTVETVDPQQFFVLDYPKAVADYNQDVYEDQWNRYFFTDVAEWEGRFGDEAGADWRQSRALRHGGKANVLFCDGHVEALGIEELAANDPRWHMGGSE